MKRSSSRVELIKAVHRFEGKERIDYTQSLQNRQPASPRRVLYGSSCTFNFRYRNRGRWRIIAARKVPRSCDQSADRSDRRAFRKSCVSKMARPLCLTATRFRRGRDRQTRSKLGTDRLGFIGRTGIPAACDDGILWRGWESYGRPQWITFNGRGFDLPVMELAAFRYGLSVRTGFKNDSNSYSQPRNRFNVTSHLDLQEFFTNSGATWFRGGLDLLARMLGKPARWMSKANRFRNSSTQAS